MPMSKEQLHNYQRERKKELIKQSQKQHKKISVLKQEERFQEELLKEEKKDNNLLQNTSAKELRHQEDVVKKNQSIIQQSSNKKRKENLELYKATQQSKQQNNQSNKQSKPIKKHDIQHSTNPLALYDSLNFISYRIPQYIAIQLKQFKKDPVSFYPKLPYPYIPTKQERKQIKRVWKIIQDNPSFEEAISLTSILYNNEIPFELTTQQVQSMDSVDFFTEEYKELLYLAFDKYDTVEEAIKGFKRDREYWATHYKNGRRKKKVTNWLVKWLKFSERYEKGKLFRKRLWLLHTFRRILTVKTGKDWTIDHYHRTWESKPEWYKEWKLKKLEEEAQKEAEELRLLQEEIDRLDAEELQERQKELEEKENKLQKEIEEKMKQLQSAIDNFDIKFNNSDIENMGE